MRTKQELELLREQAVTLRREGKSLRQIKQILGPMSNLTLHDALRGVPPLDWTVRPNAKDEQRAKARELRAQGMDYEEIATALGVAKSSVSLWVRDLPRPDRLSYAECRKRSAEGAQRYWATERGVREARRAADRVAAAAQIGDLTDRELLIACAIAYWCERAKSKPHRLAEQVNFINSDIERAEPQPHPVGKGANSQLPGEDSNPPLGLPGKDLNLRSVLQRHLSCLVRRPGTVSADILPGTGPRYRHSERPWPKPSLPCGLFVPDGPVGAPGHRHATREADYVGGWQKSNDGAT